MANAADNELEKILLSVDDTPLGDDRVFAVRKALLPVTTRWRDIGEGLGISGGKLAAIGKANFHSPNNCMGGMVREWLSLNYDTRVFGEPSWRKLVEIVWSPVGGNNRRHARDLAKEHPGSKEKTRPVLMRGDSIRLEVSALREQLQEQERRTAELASSQREKQQLMEAVQKITELEQQLRKSSTESDSSSKEVAALQQQLREQGKKIEELASSQREKQQLKEAVGKIAALEQQLRALKSTESDSSSKEVAALREQLQDQEKRMEELASSQMEKQQLTEAIRKNAELEQQLRALKQLSQSDSSSKEVAALREQLQEQGKKIEKLAGRQQLAGLGFGKSPTKSESQKKPATDPGPPPPVTLQSQPLERTKEEKPPTSNKEPPLQSKSKDPPQPSSTSPQKFGAPEKPVQQTQHQQTPSKATASKLATDAPPPAVTLQPQPLERTKEEKPPTSDKQYGTQGKPAQESQQQQTPGRATAKKTIKLKWKSRREAPIAMSGGAYAVSGATAYYSGGSSKIFKYDSDKDEWSQLPDYPSTLYGLAVVNGYLTAVGGYKTTNTLLSLDESSGSWKKIFPQMPTARDQPAVLCTAHSLVVAGGEGRGMKRLDTVEIMDTNSLQWSSASNLPEPLKQMLMTVCGEQIYMLGGKDKDGDPTNVVYTCSLSALLQSCRPPSLSRSTQPNVWQRVANVPSYRSTCISIAGQLVSVGGCGLGAEPKDEVYQYDPAANSWSIIGHMPTACFNCIAVVLPHERLLVMHQETVEVASVV